MNDYEKKTMDERRLELRIGSLVNARDGNCGHIQQLVIDPHQEKVIGLVVKPDFLSKSAVTIPIEQVEDVTESEVRLKLYCQQVLSLPEYKEDAPLALEDQRYFIEKDEFVTSSSAGIEILRAPGSRDPGMVESQILQKWRLPLAIGLRAAQHVFCKDGRIGRVHLLLLNPSGKIQGFVMQTGTWDHRDVIVPLDWIQEVDQENVHLSVEKQAVDQLDEYVGDELLAREINYEIRENNSLTETQFSEIGVKVQDGIVTLRGHVPTTSDKLPIENVVNSIPGVLGIENRLAADDELTIEVAQALGRDRHTRLAMISVNTRAGIVTLRGQGLWCINRWTSKVHPSIIGKVN